MSESNPVPESPPPVESPPPSAEPPEEPGDPRAELHALAASLMRAPNRRCLFDYLRLRRLIRSSST